MSWLPASIKRIRWKAIEKRWRNPLPHCKSIGAFCCHGRQSFDPICRKTLCSRSPPPMMLHIKLDQDWPTGLRDINFWMCKIFVIQGQVTPKWVVWSGPKSNLSELLCLYWLPTSLMTIRSKMNELAWRQHFPIISLWDFLDAQGQLTPQSVVRSGWNSNSSKILCMSSLPASIKRIGSKTTENRSRHCFLHYKLMGAFCCHGNQSFDLISPKTVCAISPTLVMLHIKFDQDWPTGFRDIQVWKCGRRTTDDYGWRTIGIL